MFLPIAMLHHISDDAAHKDLGGWCISRQSFLRLLNFLEAHQYKTFCFTDFARYKEKLPSKSICLSFDDCPKNLFDFAIPELVKRGMKASFYMPTAYLNGYNEWDVREGRPKVPLMSEADIAELNNLGMEVGAHGHRHVKLKDVKTNEELEEELGTSKRILEGIIKKPVLSFAYPFASVPDHHRQVLTKAGYQYGLSIYQNFEDRFALRRFGYYDIDTEERIARKLSPWYRLYRRLSDPITNH